MDNNTPVIDLTKWINVKDKLPDYDEYVLWYTGDGRYFVEALDKDGNPWLWGSEPDDPFDLAPATHWQPLPEPPKK